MEFKLQNEAASRVIVTSHILNKAKFLIALIAIRITQAENSKLTRKSD